MIAIAPLMTDMKAIFKPQNTTVEVLLTETTLAQRWSYGHNDVGRSNTRRLQVKFNH